MTEKYDVEANVDEQLMVKRVNQVRGMLFKEHPKEPINDVCWDIVVEGITLGYVYGHTDGERAERMADK